MNRNPSSSSRRVAGERPRPGNVTVTPTPSSSRGQRLCPRPPNPNGIVERGAGTSSATSVASISAGSSYSGGNRNYSRPTGNGGRNGASRYGSVSTPSSTITFRKDDGSQLEVDVSTVRVGHTRGMGTQVCERLYLENLERIRVAQMAAKEEEPDDDEPW